MTYVRVTRDQRGYETTLLLHTAGLGGRPRVLYWYRTAPGVRVGRPALDEEAIRSIEEQHPDIEFDWPQLLEEANTSAPEVERRPERRRKPPKLRDPDDEPARTDIPVTPAQTATAAAVTALRDESPPAAEHAAFPERHHSTRGDEGVASGPPRPDDGAVAAVAAAGQYGTLATRTSSTPRNPLLDQLVGREIATRLRTRYDDLSSRIAQVVDADARAQWQARADALDPDRWTTPDAILHGVQHADRLLDELRRELP